MDRKKLLVAGVLIGFIICFFSVFMVISFGLALSHNVDTDSFNNSNPELTAVSIARLNEGIHYGDVYVSNVHLTDDGKYWIVSIDSYYIVTHMDVTIDSKTLMSKNVETLISGRKVTDGEWRSLDELKASYIAEIQIGGLGELVGPLGKPQKITMGSKEIWEVPVTTDISDNGTDIVKYIYVDLATGKSKNTWDEFNKVAGTDDWLTLKEVDDVINNGDWNYSEPRPFKDALRNLYQNSS